MDIKMVAIAGSRHFYDYKTFCEKVDRILSRLDNVIILSGGANGADTLAEQYAKDRNIGFRLYPANWSRYEKAAGPIRNAQMIQDAHYLIAFNGGGPGTSDVIKKAKAKGIPTRVINFEKI